MLTWDFFFLGVKKKNRASLSFSTQNITPQLWFYYYYYHLLVIKPTLVVFNFDLRYHGKSHKWFFLILISTKFSPNNNNFILKEKELRENPKSPWFLGKEDHRFSFVWFFLFIFLILLDFTKRLKKKKKHKREGRDQKKIMHTWTISFLTFGNYIE